jgi:hypothetical protein
MAHLSLSLLGPFQVTLDGQAVTGFKSNKVRALLAYLAVEAHRPHRREVLAGLLWPDWPDRDALSNLRYALSDLRRVISDRTAEPPFLLIPRQPPVQHRQRLLAGRRGFHRPDRSRRPFAKLRAGSVRSRRGHRFVPGQFPGGLFCRRQRRL